MEPASKTNPFWIITAHGKEGPFSTIEEASDWASLWIGYNPWRIVVELAAIQDAISKLDKFAKH